MDTRLITAKNGAIQFQLPEKAELHSKTEKECYVLFTYIEVVQSATNTMQVKRQFRKKAYFLKEGIWTEGLTAYADTFETTLAIINRLYPEEQKKMNWQLFHELYGCVKEWINRHAHCNSSLCGVRIKYIKGVKKFCEKWIPTH